MCVCVLISKLSDEPGVESKCGVYVCVYVRACVCVRACVYAYKFQNTKKMPFIHIIHLFILKKKT